MGRGGRKLGFFSRRPVVMNAGKVKMPREKRGKGEGEKYKSASIRRETASI